MPLITGEKPRAEYDAIVVGSGAGGGMAAYVLAQAGVKVLMLEAGRNYKPAEETAMMNLPVDAPLRGAATADKPFGFYDATVGGNWNTPGEPYTKAPGTRFLWWRPRMLGGRTNHWGRISLRMGPYDFKPRSRDGLGFDWPVSYEEMAPYYDRTEALIGVWGSNEGLENTPNSSPGILLPPPRPRAYELLAQKGTAKLGIPCIPSRCAILSTTLDHARVPAFVHPESPRAQAILAEHMQQRLACFWATECGRGCSIGANFQSTTVLIPPAVATGNLDIITDAMVREVTMDRSGKASGVSYVDRATRSDVQVRARVVVLAASALESARILLNSKSPAFPDGLANGSGLVGRYIMDSVGSSVKGQIPALENCPPSNEEGGSALHLYMPWWLYRDQAAGKLDFARGYHIEFGADRRRLPKAGVLGELGAVTRGAYGKRLKQEARRYFGSFMGFSGRGEMIPNENSYCDIDPEVVDEWGIPVLRFHWKWSSHEINQAKHMQRTFAAIIEAMGGRVLTKLDADDSGGISVPGEIIHEVGGVMMGADPRRSVLDPHCRTWEVRNLFVADGGPFVSSADKNPTLTILALAWRTADHILDQMKKRAV